MSLTSKPQRFCYRPASTPLTVTRFVYTSPIGQDEGALADGQEQHLCHLLVRLINETRQRARLTTVQWDDLAAQVGRLHAQEMALHDYFSHWNLKNNGPDGRYSLANGSDAVMENLYMCWQGYPNGRAAPITDWSQVIHDAHDSLMGSEGHRANILDPDHTHLGIGLTHNSRAGKVYVVEEFLNRYLELDPVPRSARVGTPLIITGCLLPEASSPLINLAYEPIPQPLTVAELNHHMPKAYQSAAKFFRAMTPNRNNGRFSVEIILDHQGQAGLYHILIWVKARGRDVLASNVIVKVEL